VEGAVDAVVGVGADDGSALDAAGAVVVALAAGVELPGCDGRWRVTHHASPTNTTTATTMVRARRRARRGLHPGR